MRQIIVDFGSLDVFGHTIPMRIYGYGLMLVLGFLLGIWLARWRARRAGESPDALTQCGLLALAGGVLGARIAYVIQHWKSQFANESFAAVFNITSGGLIYYGGLALATVFVIVFLRFQRLPIRRHLDIIAVSLMVGLAFGRAGCLLNGCCFGAECRADSLLAARFPMYSKPLIKLAGGDNPFSQGTDVPSPVYQQQLAKGLVQPDERLLLFRSGMFPKLHSPRYLHRKLHRDQLTVMFGDPGKARQKFDALAGLDGRINLREWRDGLAAEDGLLRGSEMWDDAVSFDTNRDEQLGFTEAREYLETRREFLAARYRGKPSEAEKQAINEYLQADLIALAEHSHAKPVKPAQALGIVNALLLAALLAGFYRLRTREGQVFALLLVLYPITRFMLEGIRADNPHNLLSGVLTHNQYTSLAMMTAGVVLMIVLQKFPPSAGPVRSQRLAAQGVAASITKPRNHARVTRRRS